MAERENPYGPVVKKLDENIEKLKKKIADDEAYINDHNTGVGFVVLRSQHLATLLRDNSKIWS